MNRTRHIRSGGERLAHWLLAVSVLILIPSGVEIYRAAPFYAIELRVLPGLGGSLTGALLWHFAAAWGLLSALAMLGLRRLRGRGVVLWPLGLTSLRGNLRHALSHDDLGYNPVQKFAYLTVFALLGLVILSGLAMWKPVQFQTLTHLLGGYEAARRIHFCAMVGIGCFTVGHVVMALIVPRTILGMILGFKKDKHDGAA
ncbi:MAG: hypothetical protein HC844_06910 [Tabrizicola sp.]|nr:hypothetical protein [Tabrizicola sp.]